MIPLDVEIIAIPKPLRTIGISSFFAYTRSPGLEILLSPVITLSRLSVYFKFNTSSRSLVHALKYSRADYLAKYMGAQMAVRYKNYPELAEAEVVMPVPLFPKRNRTRGYNQSELLAENFAPLVGLPLDSKSLVRIKNTISQTTLGRVGRLANMKGAFAYKKQEPIKGKTVLLIDDVATTGATLEGCAEALKVAGAKKVMAYTFARE